MRLGFRGRLVVVSVALVALAGLISLTYLELKLRGDLVVKETAALLRQAESFRAALETMGSDPAARADRMAKIIGGTHPIRLTLVDDEGRVLADSDVPAEHLSSLDDHRPRPELISAFAGEVGVVQRYSTTSKTEMLYVAIPYDRGDGRFAVRAGTPLSTVDTLVAQLRLALGIAALLGVAAALLMSGFASYLTGRTLRTVVEGARRLAEGSATGPIHLRSRDELEHIAGSVNRLAADLTLSVEALAEERDRASAILASMREGVVALDEERRVTLANPAALELLGLEHDPVGRSLVELVRAPAMLNVARRTTADPVEETEIELAQPQARCVRVRATKRREGEGVVLVLHDVTEMRRLETVRSEFVANVSHELRTPVAIIRANAEVLKDGALYDEKRAPAFIDALYRNAERLSLLVSDLLDLARIERQELVADIGDIPVATLCQRVADELAPRAASRRQEVRVSVPEALVARADERALEQVLVNLVDNAVKYADEGGVIELRARLAGGSVVLEVADNGPGIPAAQRERVFERFHRLDAGRSRDMGGTGLGLAIVKHLALSMNGRVGVRDNAPKGSVFFVELPRPPDGGKVAVLSHN